MDGTGPGRAEGCVEAMVHVAGEITRYRRAGRGPAVLLLESSGGDGRACSPLFAGLARTFRVIRPSLTDLSAKGSLAPVEVASRLARMVDGLGLEEAGLVLAPEGIALLEPLLDACGERISRVVALRASAAGARPDVGESRGAPLLEVAPTAAVRPWSDPDFARICAFLADHGRSLGREGVSPR